MESKVTINIAKFETNHINKEGYKHFFKIDMNGDYLFSDDPDFKPAKDFKEVLKSIKKNYPSPEFNITVTEWKATGKIIS